MIASLHPSGGQSRRDFVKSASLLAASATIGAAAGSDSTATARTPPITSLAQPLVPPDHAPAPASVPLAPPDKQPPDLEVPAPAGKKIGWAIVGLGQLSLEQVLPAFLECKHSTPVALVSGHADKARAVAATYGLDAKNIYDYTNIDRLAQNPAIDVVYIVLPNSLHAEYTIKALKAGKHVLCEKPMAVSVEECERMIAAAREARRTLGVAYRLHHEPHTQRAFTLAKSRSVGEPKLFTSSNCQNVKAPNIRLSAELGGGAVGDVGVYSINAARHLLGEEPSEVAAFAHWPKNDPRFRETPESVSYLLRFPSGALAQCDCSFGTSSSSRFRLLGTKGFLEMDPAFPYQGQRLRISEKPGDDSPPQLVEPQLKAVNQFAGQFDHFSQCVLNGSEPRTPGEDGLADLRVALAIHEAIRTGRTVKIGGESR